MQPAQVGVRCTGYICDTFLYTVNYFVISVNDNCKENIYPAIMEIQPFDNDN